MYEEIIQKYNPKPILNLNWYKNEDLYSEGDVEDLIIKLIADNEPENYVQAIADNYNWSTFYHLTHTRKNILNWYPFEPESSVLEIGCGMGAITNLLCDRCRKVTSVELSYRRATATLLRCREKENLEIIVGNLNDISFPEKFDYITLIGVLEYQGSYTNTDYPYLDFLKKIRTLLKPSGKLLIAIENQYGLKYWCGAAEDHTGIPFGGINQYELTNQKVKTFSKNTLNNLIHTSGFQNTFFYYPMPDYKLPSVIYSQCSLPKNSQMFNIKPYYIPDSYTLVANEEKIYQDLIDNQVFEFFANSYLVECSNSNDIGQVKFATLNSTRMKEYQIGTLFTKDGRVEKISLQGDIVYQHLSQILRNEDTLEKQGILVWKSTEDIDRIFSPFLDVPTLEDILLGAYHRKDIDEIYRIWDWYLNELIKSSDNVSWQENILYSMDLNIVPNKEKYGHILKTGFIDMIPRNAFWYNDKGYWFDQEWILENVPVKYIFYRALTVLYNDYKFLQKVLPISVVAHKYDLLVCWKELESLEKLFTSTVIDLLHVAERNGFGGNPVTDSKSAINRLLKR